MYRKLVKLDPHNGWRFSEVDPIALRRSAQALKDYIERHIQQHQDEFEIRRQVLPLCDGALQGVMNFPLRRADLPLTYPYREGLLPIDFERLWASFSVAATGTPLEKLEEVEIKGERWAHMEFEEAGDWPDEVRRRSEERRRARAASTD